MTKTKASHPARLKSALSPRLSVKERIALGKKCVKKYRLHCLVNIK